MCLKVVIKDQVEDTKFTQEKLKKSAFLACTSILSRFIGTPPQFLLDLSRILLPPQ